MNDDHLSPAIDFLIPHERRMMHGKGLTPDDGAIMYCPDCHKIMIIPNYQKICMVLNHVACDGITMTIITQ